MTTLLLVRHGRTAWNAERRLQGRLDIPLDEEGAAAVRSLRPLVAELAPDRVVCSPLRRARGTADLLGHPEPREDERWQEADLGEWTGASSAELRAADGDGYARWRAGLVTPPGGEPFAAMAARVREALADAVAGGGTTLVVTHGGPVRAACRELLGLVPARVVPVSPASLTVIDVAGDGGEALAGRLRTYNSTGRTASAATSADPPD